jgi:hypothetical protein
LTDHASEAANTVVTRTADLARQARYLTDDLVEKTRAASAAAGTAFEKAKRPFTGAPERDERAVAGALEVMQRDREAACAVEAAASEHR